jgi:hypothetical protein
VLTPEEGITALQTGRLPLPEESVESQKRLHDYHEDGLYQPLLNNPNLVIPPSEDKGQGQQPQAPQKKAGGAGGIVGRPPGTGTPKTINNIGKIGKKISAQDVANNLARFDLLEGSIENYLKEKFKKKKLAKEQKEIVKEIAETIAINEKPEKWLESIATYISEPVQISSNLNQVQEISERHGVDIKTAILLMHSQINEE